VVQLLLRDRTVHQVAVVDSADQPQTCYYVSSLSAVLDYVVRRFRDDRSLFEQPVLEAGVGTYDRLVTVRTTDSLGAALELFETRGVSVLPVVDPETGAVRDVLRRSWVARLLSPTVVGQPRFDEPLAEVLEALRGEVGSTAPPFVLPRDPLRRAMLGLSQLKVSSLLVVDGPDTMRLQGIVALADVFGYFVAGAG